MTTLNKKQIAQFEQDGFLVVENVLSDTDLQPVIDEYDVHLDRVAQEMFAAGKISSTYPDLPFGKRYTAILGEDTSVFDRLEITLPLENDDFPADATVFCGKAVFNLLTHPKILDVVESLIGSEIYSNPVQHIRIKPSIKDVPASIMANSYVGRTTWHQDMGALMDDAIDTQVLTVWVAISDAPKEMGCLVAVPGSHKKDELTVHCPGKGITAENFIPSKLLGDVNGVNRPKALPVQRGGIVLLNRYTEHAALANTSGKLRWSFDLRYNPIGQPTGRPAFPGFVARSRQNPASEIDHAQWADLWENARQQLVNRTYGKPVFNAERWEKYVDAPVCA